MATLTARRVVTAVAALTVCAAPGGAVCVDWKATGRNADVEAADVVFEGRVTKVEVDTTIDCAPDKAHLEVTRVWKGPKLSKHIILQDTDRMTEVIVEDGSHVPSTCPIWVEGSTLEQGKTYIVFASVWQDDLRPFPCSYSEPPTAAMRQRLDKWLKGKGARR